MTIISTRTKYDRNNEAAQSELLTLTDVQDFRGVRLLRRCKNWTRADNIHLLPAEDLLATFSRWLYVDYRGKTPRASMVKTMLEHVAESYDYILIDTPPALGDITMNA